MEDLKFNFDFDKIKENKEAAISVIILTGVIGIYKLCKCGIYALGNKNSVD